MPRLLVILLVSWAYVGCAGNATHKSFDPSGPRRGGTIRWIVADARMTDAVVRSSVSRPLVELRGAGPAPIARSVGSVDGCTGYAFQRDFRYPDGQEVGPEEIAERWEAELRRLCWMTSKTRT